MAAPETAETPVEWVPTSVSVTSSEPVETLSALAAAPVPIAPASSAAVVAAAAPAKTLPAEAVRYLVPPAPVYPKLSRRQGESGRVLVRVYIDEAGVPRSVQVSESSGHARLDDSAQAAVQQARFKPYSENGRPTAGWAFIPLSFDLEP
jgi:protein TonB